MRELLSLLPKPSRYIGVEEGSVHKPLSSLSLHIGLAFPDMYEVGMSYLGQKILYGILNDNKNWYAERVFTPCRDAGKILKDHGVHLATLESDTPLAQLDALGFSVTHELCYTNILYMLDLAGIPFRAKDRDRVQADNTPWPIIMAGGGCTLEAEPIAPFMDLMILGEGEEVMPKLMAELEKAKKDACTRKETLERVRHISGIYVPEFFVEEDDPKAKGRYVSPLYDDYTFVTRQVVSDMDAVAYPARQTIPFGAVHNRLSLEIGRGCTRGCRFCQAGIIYRPARERSVPNLQELLGSCLTSTGFDDVSFLSLSTGDYSALKELFMSTVDRCSAEQIAVSLPSLRVGSIDDSIMERMAGIRRTGATLAPEAGSQRLRDVINKGITEEEFVLHMQKLFEHGWQQVKLYFMIGLPTETDEDLLAIVDLCRKARDAAGPGIKSMQITAAVSPFVPKAHTPFQWQAQIPLAEIKRRVGVLLDAVKKEKRIKLRWHEPEMSSLEGIFSRGDRRLAPVLESAFHKGMIFSSWIEGFSLDTWLDAMNEHGLTVEEFIRGRNLDEPLPWDHLHSGIDIRFFKQELKRALKESTVNDCRYGDCLQCGVCDTKGRVSLLEKPENRADVVAYTNRLNNDQRDQQAHTVNLDQYGRVMVRQNGEVVAGRPEKKSQPPTLPEHLIRKVSHLRFWYARRDSAIYLSQLEIQDIIERSLRRARLPLTFSQGYHPLPIISFGRALPVGVGSECEWFSIIVSERMELEPLFHKLAKGMPQGLQYVSVEEIPLHTKGTDSPIETYSMELAVKDTDNFIKAWNAIKEASSLPWERETKKGIRHLDARSFFTGISCTDDGKCTFRVDWSAKYVSPLALSIAALHSVGYIAPLENIRLIKIAQEGLAHSS